MILYFSGTGNSAYVAKRVGKEISDEVLDLFKKIKAMIFQKYIRNVLWLLWLRHTRGEFRTSYKIG